MSYALSHILRGVPLRLVAALSVGCLSASAGSLNGTGNGWQGSVSCAGSATVTRDQSGLVTVNYTASATNPASPAHAGIMIAASWREGPNGPSGQVDGIVATSANDRSQSKSGSFTLNTGTVPVVTVLVGCSIWDGLSWVGSTGGFSVDLALGEAEELSNYYIPINYRNTTDFTAWLNVYTSDYSESIHEEEIPPGGAVSKMIGPIDDPDEFYNIVVGYAGVRNDDYLGWVTADELTRTEDVEVGTVEAVHNTLPEPEPPSEPAQDLPTQETSDGAPPSSESTAPADSVYKAAGGDSSAALTAGTFENGIRQVVQAVARSGRGQSSITVNNSGVESRLDQANLFLDGINTKASLANDKLDELIAQGEQSAESEAVARELNDAQKAAYDQTPTINDMQSDGQAEATSIGSKFPTVVVNPSAGVSGSEPDFTISLPATMGGAVFDLNPFRSDRLQGPVAWFRSAVAWLVLVTFGLWLYNAINESVVNVTVVQQAKGNAVAGGTGGQLTAVVAAAAMSAIIGTAVVGFVSWSFGDIGFSALASVFSTNPLATMPGKAAWMLDKVFPVATMLSALLARVSFKLYAMQLHAVSAALIRFIVP